MLGPVTWNRILHEVRRLCESVEDILPPFEVLGRFREAARKGMVERHVLGTSRGGHPIEAFTTDAGKRSTLWYAFPDPGEAVGGTVLCVLLEALARGDTIFDRLGTRWSWIPCLNLDDQPADGRRLEPVKKAADVREVDWCVHNPRPETTALLSHAAAIRPDFIYALHDEYHSGESLPVYLPTSVVWDDRFCHDVRQSLEAVGFRIHEGITHPTMGTGFLQMGGAPDYPNSTFHALSKHGPVLICEVSPQLDLKDADLVAAQLAVGLLGLTRSGEALD